MDLLAVSINAIVVAVVGGIVTWLGKGRFEAIDRRFDRLESRLDGRIHSLVASFGDRFVSLEARLDGRIDRLDSRLDALRSDLTQVALAVGVPRAQND